MLLMTSYFAACLSPHLLGLLYPCHIRDYNFMRNNNAKTIRVLLFPIICSSLCCSDFMLLGRILCCFALASSCNWHLYLFACYLYIHPLWPPFLLNKHTNHHRHTRPKLKLNGLCCIVSFVQIRLDLITLE